MSAARAIEPVITVVTLWIGQPLLALAFWTLADHFLVIEIVSKHQAAARTARQLATGDGGAAILRGADENRAAVAADGFVF